MPGKYLKKCPICGGRVKRNKTAYVVENIVIEPQMEADVCTECGEEFYTAEQVANAQKKAAALGVLPAQLEEERRLKKLGGSLIVSLPRGMVKTLGLGPQEKVKISLTKDGISISKVKE